MGVAVLDAAVRQACTACFAEGVVRARCGALPATVYDWQPRHQRRALLDKVVPKLHTCACLRRAGKISQPRGVELAMLAWLA